MGYLRDCADRGIDVYQKDLYESVGFSWKTAWKVVRFLEDEGVVNREVRLEGPHLRSCFVLMLEDWYRLDDEQRERMVTALESMAESMRRQTEIMESRSSPRAAPKPATKRQAGGTRRP